mgnify:CR=1 FL=1
MGSNSDWPKLESAEKVFQEFGIDLEVTVASAHRTPELVKAFAEGARDAVLMSLSPLQERRLTWWCRSCVYYASGHWGAN